MNHEHTMSWTYNEKFKQQPLKGSIKTGAPENKFSTMYKDQPV